MTGAISLAGMSALRSGAGLVTLAVPKPCLEVVASFEPSYMTLTLPADALPEDWSGGSKPSDSLHGKMDELLNATSNATCVACGPGIGRKARIQSLVWWLNLTVPSPMIVDADALFALAQRTVVLDNLAGPRVLTPHEGEFKRFLSEGERSRDELEKEAESFAKTHGVIVVLKGPRTLITDGTASIHNTTGNPGMATGGCGDVLTGIITALICQGLSAFEAAHLGVFVHGLAGDLAAQQLGQVSMIASDLIRFLPAAFQSLDD